jgi:acyl-CoA thioesterase FadM
MYEYKIQIGISHIGKDGLLKYGAAWDLLQNATWFQIDTMTFFKAFFRENNAGMYLISRQVDFIRRPAYGELVSVRSWPVNCDRLFGYRNTAIYDETGALCVGAYTVGPFMDLAAAKPMRISQNMVDTVELFPPLDMEILPRKIPVPGGESLAGASGAAEAVRVQNYHLDNYGHMNNARYIDIASAYIPDGFTVRRVRAEYKKAALTGDLIVPKIYKPDGGALVITLCSPGAKGQSSSEQEIYTVMEFSG